MQGQRDILFKGLTRPPLFLHVTYTFFVLNVLINIELFISTGNFTFVFIVMPLAHLAGMIACEWDPFYFDLWRVRFSRTPPLRSRITWGCNSYLP